MIAWLAIAAVALAALSGVVGALVPGRDGGERVHVALLIAAAACGVAAGGLGIAGVGGTELAYAWPLPAAAFHVEVDPLSGMFLCQVFVLAALGAIYGLGYRPHREHPDGGRRLRLAYGLMTAGMALVVISRNAVLFMVGWEVMALAAFVAVTADDRREEVRAAGYLYLVATRIGSFTVIAMFVLLQQATGSWDLGAPLAGGHALAAPIFVLALVGFGVKAGLMPVHVWLPGAHANAPSQVSAVMSGVLIKMGIYGICRITSLVPDPPPWWGGVVLAAGVVSGVLGVAFALGQHDIKRLLAYHSVENIGIIAIGLGLALLGRSYDMPALVALGLGGALLHTWNHGLFKALLFLAAGSVIHATGTREIDQLGGVLRRMRWTGLWFLVGAVAICGLPPLNGFVSELLVYLGLFDVVRDPTGSLWLAGVFAAALLALIGGLAVACFVKVFGAVFLGEPRTPAAEAAHEAPRSMLAPMAILAALCAVIGVAAPAVAPVLDAATAAWAPELTATSLDAAAPLAWLPAVYLPLAALAILIGAWLYRRTRAAPAQVGTWDCGYARPTARMQYTASSFAQMLVAMFRWVLRPHGARPRLTDPFPTASARFQTHVPDVVLDRMLASGQQTRERALRYTHWIQRGYTSAYVLYVLVALVLLLLWKGG